MVHTPLSDRSDTFVPLTSRGPPLCLVRTAGWAFVCSLCEEYLELINVRKSLHTIAVWDCEAASSIIINEKKGKYGGKHVTHIIILTE